jgi:hypothetical protein
LGVGGGDEGAFVQFDAEVAGVGVRKHVAGIVAVAQALADEVVEAELLGSRDIDDAVGWGPDSNLGHRAGDVVGGHPGWMRTGARRTVVPSVVASAMRLTNSKNWVAWTIE